MDARSYLRYLRFPVLVFVLLASGCVAHVEADTEALARIDSGFEGTRDGWVVAGGTLTVATASPAPHGGLAAGRVVAAGTSAVVLSSQVWRVPSEAAGHTLTLWLYDNDPRIALAVEVSFHDAGYVAIGPPNSASLSGDVASWRRVVVGPVTAPAGTAFAKVTVRGAPSAAGASFLVDDAALLRADPPPTPTPTASPTPTPTPTASPTPTPEPTASPTPVPTVVAVATLTPTPSMPTVFASLQNGDFEHTTGLTGWSAVGGSPSLVTPGLGGSMTALRLTSSTASTKYVQQAVSVAPLAWYAGSVQVQPGGAAEAVWLRIAWYASPVGAGAQLATVDSPAVVARDQVSLASTGPVRAPAEARTARVRIMLRPAGIESAHVVADDVRFDASAPPAATPTPAPTSTPPAATPAGAQPAPLAPGAAIASVAPPRAGSVRATPTGTASAAARPASGAVAVGAVWSDGARRIPGTVGDASMLRIVEVLPDPSEPGTDSDFEWIEVANLGREPAALAGVLLADNQGTVALPDVTLGAGSVLVIAGRRAAVPEASAFRPAQGISNGLGNGGDRLALSLTDGTVIDALSYGTDTTYDSPPLPAPGPGASLLRRFADDGTYAGFEVVAKPTPGVHDRGMRAAAAAAPTSIAHEVDPLAWAALALIGVGALGAAAVQRMRVVRGEQGERGVRG